MEVDVQCPDGVYEGESILVNFGETQFNVQIPPGVLPGDVFKVALPAPPEADQLADTLNAVLDALEDHDDPALDEIVDGNCAQFSEWEKGDECPLEWHDLFAAYVQQSERFIDEVLALVNDCTAEDIFEHAQAYAGSDERCERLITRLLAMAALILADRAQDSSKSAANGGGNGAAASEDAAADALERAADRILELASKLSSN